MIPDWVLEQLHATPFVWEKFQQFPHNYQRLKINWITEIRSQSRRDEAQKRLNYLIKMTGLGKKYGTIP